MTGRSNLPDPDPRRLVSIVIPTYDEATTIEHVLRRVADLDLRMEVLVVDDGSSDDTVAIVETLDGDLPTVRLLRHERNRGKGAAVRTGIQASTGDVVVIQDADLEYDPRDLPKLVAPLLEGVADAVYGTRFRGGEPQRAHLFWHSVGNRTLSLMTNVLFNTTITSRSRPRDHSAIRASVGPRRASSLYAGITIDSAGTGASIASRASARLRSRGGSDHRPGARRRRPGPR